MPESTGQSIPVHSSIESFNPKDKWLTMKARELLAFHNKLLSNVVVSSREG